MSDKKKETYYHVSEKIDKTFLAGLSHDKLNERLKEAYLGIIVNHDTIANPLVDIPFVAQDNFNEYLVYLMSRPEYFYFIMKVLFGMKSFPLQCLILKELYDHRFPILLGSRGLAKTTAIAIYCLIRMIITPGIKCVITGAGFRQAKIVFEMMEAIWNKSPMLRNCFKGVKNGPTHGTDAWSFRLGDSICWALPVGHDGQKVRGFRSNLLFCVDRNTLVQTDTGLVKIVDYMKYDCDKLLNMDGDLERPSNIIKTQKTDVYEITTVNGYSIKCSSMHRLLVTDGKKTSWKVAKDLTSNDHLELDTNDYFPERYVEKDGLIVDEELGYLIGLLISEGTITNRNFIEITHTNKNLIDEIVTKFPNFNWKIYEREATVDNRGWDCKKSYSLKFCNTEFRELLKSLGLDYVSALDKEIPWCILQSPESVVQSFLKGLFIGDGSCFKYTTRGKVNVGVTYYSSSIELAKQLQILLLKFNITSGLNKRTSKLSTNPNYMLAMRGVQAFKMFSLIENPYWENYYKEGHLAKRSFKAKKHGNNFVAETTRCDNHVYIGSYKTKEEASNAIQEYLEDARPAVKVKSVKKLDYQDILYDFTMPESHSFCAGGFINHNCDEFASLPRSIFEEVMSGFLTVSAEPVDQVQHRATLRAKKLLGVQITEEDLLSDIIQNQLVLSGTAYYKHNHFYEYFKKWRSIINSGGDPEILNTIFSESEANRNWKHYSIIRIPVELIPEGFMDMDQINRIKASVNKDVFFREYSACLHPSTKILTTVGPKRIKDITIGDMVLTHKGRFKKVNKLTYQKSNHLMELDFYGNNKKMYVTDNHPIYNGNDKFISAEKTNHIIFSSVSKDSLSNKQEINIKDYLEESEYNDYGDFIRSKHGSVKLSNDGLRSIYILINKGFNIKEISEKLKLKYSMVWNASRFNSFNKINPVIKLDYDLGIVFGYYASEGSIGANDRAVSFALDGHIDENILKFVNELKLSIKKSFGIDATEYNKKDNTVSITINNKLIASFIKKICSGICYNKLMDHEILFSNEDFMRGFIVGFWNGDGHKRFECSKSQICSENLMSQIRLILSYFKVPHSYYTKKGGVSKFKNIEYIHSNRFKIEMFKQNNKLFLNEFYNEINEYSKGQSKYYIENDNICYKLKSRKRISFDGYVYNIEVDDDHSYHTEFGCVHNCFSDDSDGFFKRSLIEFCTLSLNNKIYKDGKEVRFNPALYGDKNKKYVYGVDPAYQGDNFAIVILEINGTYRRVVHCWTTQASDHKQMLKDFKEGKISINVENQYYDYCARKIRTLMKRFPCAYIALDAQGGGRPIMEALMDPTKLEPGEEIILPAINPDEKPQETDMMQGEHIIKIFKNTSENITEANHALKKDMETRDIIFPYHDSISYIESEFYDTAMGESSVLYDTLEDCIADIEELKNELSTIAISETKTGKESFDTPETKGPNAKKGRLKKDRYSALLMANWVARSEENLITRPLNSSDVITMGGYVDKNNPDAMFIGNSKLTQRLNDLYS